jgi:MFS-type transporter involved in bile tolerance (Atg22 family)
MRPLSTLQIVLYSVGAMGSNLVYGFANFAFPLFLEFYHLPQVIIGPLAQERSLVGSIVQPVVGAISDRLPPNRLGKRRPFFLIGVPLTAISLLYLSTYPPLWVVIAIMTVFSFFMAVANDPYTALLADITPSEQRGRVGGVQGTFVALGTAGAALVAFFFWGQNKELVFQLVAVGMVLCFAVTFFGVKEPPIVRHPAERKARASVGEYARDLFGRREIMKYLAATFVFWMGNGGISPFITRFGVHVLGFSEETSFLLVLPAIVGAAVFALPAGLLTERFGKKKVLNFGMLVFGSAALVGGLTVQGMTDVLILMLIVGVAIAIANSLIFPQLADMIPPERAGEFAGIGAFVWSFAQPIGAFGAGFIADSTGTLRAAFAAGGILMILGFVIMLSVHAPPVRKLQPPTPGPDLTTC